MYAAKRDWDGGPQEKPVMRMKLVRCAGATPALYTRTLTVAQVLYMEQ
jgi:hypothetical protein